jgi:hypothetical protein
MLVPSGYRLLNLVGRELALEGDKFDSLSSRSSRLDELPGIRSLTGAQARIDRSTPRKLRLVFGEALPCLTTSGIKSSIAPWESLIMQRIYLAMTFLGVTLLVFAFDAPAIS